MEVKSKPRLHASWIDYRAKEIVQKLQQRGHKTFLVGGCVRDLLVGIHPKDFDIATSALPQEVKRIVPYSYVIGKRFRLVLVRRGNDQFEVATFRREGRAEDFAENEDAPQGDNFFGTPEEDARRRDFTVNALFFDPVNEELIDYVHAQSDIESRQLRMIGEASPRVLEDPIRALRAIRLSHKIGFQIESSLRAAITEHRQAVGDTILPRRREEYLKIMKLKDPARALLEMLDLGLLETCLPTLQDILMSSVADEFLGLVSQQARLSENPQTPLEIHLPLLLATWSILKSQPEFATRWDRFLKDELGLFKAEIAELEAALEFIDRLYQVESFLKRGPRRQSAFLQHASFELALKIAEFFVLLKPADLSFWKQRRYHESQAKPLASEASE